MGGTEQSGTKSCGDNHNYITSATMEGVIDLRKSMLSIYWNADTEAEGHDLSITKESTRLIL